jgi:hypothetical protein
VIGSWRDPRQQENNMSEPVMYTALNGALQRHSDGWRWKDGSTATEVEDLWLIECAPNFRCVTYGSGCVVQIPTNWRRKQYWPHGVVDPEAAAAIAALVRDYGRKARIFNEAHADTMWGITVPIEHWDAALKIPCGASWRKEHEAVILDHARSLGWAG